MMDYKEQIEELRFLSGHVPEQMCDYDGKDPLEKAADSIETLLAERDALLSEIKGDCHFCAFEWGACVACEYGSKWEWRGPQKEDKHEVGRFDKIEDAIKAREEAEIKFFGMKVGG